MEAEADVMELPSEVERHQKIPQRGIVAILCTV